MVGGSLGSRASGSGVEDALGYGLEMRCGVC
jgi:hypothetical protein